MSPSNFMFSLQLAKTKLENIYSETSEDTIINLKKLRKLSKEETVETIEETVNFVIDEKRSTSNSKCIIRKKKVIHKINDQETHVDIFEDSFTIPLHKFNLNLILSQTKVQNIEETVIVERSIQRLKQNENHVEIEELRLPVDSVNLETVLPMIDYKDIHTIFIKEERKQILKKNVETWPDLENVAREVGI